MIIKFAVENAIKMGIAELEKLIAEKFPGSSPRFVTPDQKYLEVNNQANGSGIVAFLTALSKNPKDVGAKELEAAIEPPSLEIVYEAVSLPSHLVTALQKPGVEKILIGAHEAIEAALESEEISAKDLDDRFKTIETANSETVKKLSADLEATNKKLGELESFKSKFANVDSAKLTLLLAIFNPDAKTNKV